MQTFRSKIDWWVWGFVIAMTGLLGQLLLNMLAKGTLLHYLLFAAVYGVTILLLWWPLLNTRYSIEAGQLTVKCMFLTWRIACSDIVSIQATEQSDAAPALSWQRLRIDYMKNGKPAFILLSPRNAEAFQAALNGA